MLEQGVYAGEGTAVKRFTNQGKANYRTSKHACRATHRTTAQIMELAETINPTNTLVPYTWVVVLPTW